jgi:hypothetical protein
MNFPFYEVYNISFSWKMRNSINWISFLGPALHPFLYPSHRRKIFVTFDLRLVS